MKEHPFTANFSAFTSSVWIFSFENLQTLPKHACGMSQKSQENRVLLLKRRVDSKDANIVFGETFLDPPLVSNRFQPFR